tara:strand:+ start:11355 stop:12644 length:1290 start_codon:yes stop_codon:yes gene_type:complete
MSYRKFGKNDVLINTMKAHPKSEFLIYSGNAYYNNRPRQTGQFQSASANPGNIWMSDPGYINLYEYNIDRLSGSDGKPNPLIYPYVVKDGSRASFHIDGTETESDFDAALYGDMITGYYPQTASIRRQYITSPSGTCHGDYTHKSLCGHNMDYWSLRTMLNHYGTLSPHYLVSSSYGALDGENGWNKDEQTLNLIHIPSIFYGSKIRPGTVSLQWYYTGSLIAELKDERENGELIQVGPHGNAGSGSVAGVVLYNEGFILLTGSWALAAQGVSLVDTSEAITVKKPRWLYWGAGMRDGLNYNSHGARSLLSASFGLSFEGVTKTDVITMYARAHKGEVNYSNNPTFLQYDQEQLTFTSSHVYEENKNRLIKNTVSSSYTNYEEDFKRQVYISKVAVYDDKKQLIGIATLANPVLKEEDQDLAIKIKLDI